MKNLVSVWFDMQYLCCTCKENSSVDNFVFKDLLIHDDAELIITFAGEVSVLHKNSHLVVKELWPQIKISTVRSLMV